MLSMLTPACLPVSVPVGLPIHHDRELEFVKERIQKMSEESAKPVGGGGSTHRQQQRPQAERDSGTHPHGARD